jgi:Holliday junction resolvase RusA-like endonuclease
MLTRSWGIKVYGDPEPKGSLKCIGARGQRKHVLVEDNSGSDPWRSKIAGQARRWIEEWADKHQPVAVDVTYSLARPAGHYGTGRNAGQVKLGAPVYPAQKGTGDEDKLRRLVLDALQDAGVLKDDAQVIGGENWKHFHDAHPGARAGERYDVLDRPGVVIRLRPLGYA